MLIIMACDDGFVELNINFNVVIEINLNFQFFWI